MNWMQTFAGLPDTELCRFTVYGHAPVYQIWDLASLCAFSSRMFGSTFLAWEPCWLTIGPKGPQVPAYHFWRRIWRAPAYQIWHLACLPNLLLAQYWLGHKVPSQDGTVGIVALGSQTVLIKVPCEFKHARGTCGTSNLFRRC